MMFLCWHILSTSISLLYWITSIWVILAFLTFLMATSLFVWILVAIRTRPN